MKKFLSIMLALIMVFSLLPMAALAEEAGEGEGGTTPPPPVTSKVTVTAYNSHAGVLATATVTIDKVTTFAANAFGRFLCVNGYLFEYADGYYTITPDGTDKSITLDYIYHTHEYRNGYDRYNHWEACRCGSTLSFGPHVDPATDDDGICTCGYKFSNNADLSTLWLANMNLSPRFNRETTEYEAEVFTYKPVDSTSISINLNDAKATAELPKDTSIHEGMNIFEVKVTAEDTKTTKTYTVYASLPSKVDGILVSNTGNLKDGFTTVLEPKATMHRTTASLELPKALGEKICIQADSVDSKKVVVEPIYSKWSIKIVEVTIPAEVLDMVGETKADFVIKTFSGNIVIPNAELKNLAKEGEALVFSLDKTSGDVVLTVTADGKEVKNDKVTVTSPEK